MAAYKGAITSNPKHPRECLLYHIWPRLATENTFTKTDLALLEAFPDVFFNSSRLCSVLFHFFDLPIFSSLREGYFTLNHARFYIARKRNDGEVLLLF